MPTLPAALTSELGSSLSADAMPGITDPYETTPELAWPANLGVFDRMRRGDSQVRSVLSAVKHPILGTDWSVQGKGVRPAVRDFVTAELGLTRDDEGRYRARAGGVSWDEFLRHALLHLDFGHMAFEPAYVPGPPEKLVTLADGTELRTVAHLGKLAPRMPRTFASIDVAPDGGLAGIHQYVRRGGAVVSVPIPVDRLVWFANDREGADWGGQSVLRSSYKDWLIKDTLIRLAALAVERTGMGLPVVTYPKGQRGAKRAALRIATRVRAGEDAGVALPEGWTLSLEGVTGTTRDPLPLIQYHDQQVGKAALAMVLDLGHDAGARSLGDTFDAVLLRALGRIKRYVEEVVTEHVIRDLVRINFGATEAYPTLVGAPLEDQPELTAESLKALSDAGLLGTVDDELVRDVRSRFGLPAPSPAALPSNKPAPPDLPSTVLGPVIPGGPAGGPETQALPGTPVIGPQARVVAGPGGLRAVPQAAAAAGQLPAAVDAAAADAIAALPGDLQARALTALAAIAAARAPVPA